MNELYYFGCMHQSGHYLFEQDAKSGCVIGSRYPSGDLQERFGRNGERLDGMFCPPKPWGTQRWMESNIGQWRIVSWHDHSVDARYGSHSTFIGRGYESAQALVDDAKVRFKEVFDRQPEVKAG